MTGDKWTEYTVEWIDCVEVMKRFRARLAKANEGHRAQGLPEMDENDQSVMDWVEVESENGTVGAKGCRTLSAAKTWARKNRRLDLWNAPRVIVNECAETDWGVDRETREVWELQGEGWWKEPR